MCVVIITARSVVEKALIKFHIEFRVDGSNPVDVPHGADGKGHSET